jgi:hypothetical protein
MLREKYLDSFEAHVDGIVERRFRAENELHYWFTTQENYSPGWLWYSFGLLNEGFSCWFLGQFRATLLTCQAACEAILEDLFLGEDEEKTVKELGGDWEILKNSKLKRRAWMLWKQNKISKEIYKGLREVKRRRNEIAHEGSRTNVQEVLAQPRFDLKELKERAWKALKFATELCFHIYSKYPFGPYREQWLERERKKREDWEKEVFGF